MRIRACAVGFFAAGLTLFLGVSPAAAADACSNAAVRVQQGATRLADCRAYEQVSPVDKAGGVVAFPTNGANPSAAQPMLDASSPDGSTLAYWSFAAFAEPNTGLPAQYRAFRSADGWQSKMWSPRPGFEHAWLFQGRSMFVAANEDLSIAFLSTGDRFDPDDQDAVETDVAGGEDVYVLAGDQPEWVSRPNAGPATFHGNVQFQASTEDARHIVFNSAEALTPPAVQSEEEANPLYGQLYERVNGETRIVSVDSDGSLLDTCGAVLGDQDTSAGSGTTKRGALSADGSRIFFTTPADAATPVDACKKPKRLYMREGETTVEISRSQRPGGDGVTRSARFQGATADGETVFFSSQEALTPDASSYAGGGDHLYEYDVSSGVLRLLEEDENDSLEIVGFSEDRSRVYVARAGNELELLEGGVVIPVAASVLSGELVGRMPAARVTQDGRYILFPSRANLTAFDSQGALEFYLFDADAEQLSCVSCNTTGRTPLGDASLGGDTSGDGRFNYPMIRNLSEDGRAYFSTADALVRSDENGTMDVYEWDRGRVELLSDGVNKEGSYLFAVSRQGGDVFFGTTSALSPLDTDGGDWDIYDARTDGGFLAPVAPKPCSGESCQGPPPAAPAPARAGTSVSTSFGNAAARKRCVVKKKKVKKGARAAKRSKKRAGCAARTRRVGK